MYEELVKRLRVEGEYADLVAYMHGIRPISPKDDAAKIASSWKELFEKAADAIEELNMIAASNERSMKAWAGTAVKAAEKIPRWIPVTERLPKGADASGEICENVNLLLDDGLVTCGWMNGITDKVYYINVRDDYIQKAPISRVTHWMPLPQPPKEET